MTITEKLAYIQSELKCSKSQYNSFGKYNYRSCEDILEAVKPIAKKYKSVVKCSDKIINIGNRFYIESTVILKDLESEGIEESTAFAREDEAKKGMDGSQITGSSSSYARKYALSGLFALDDTKDADYKNICEICMSAVDEKIAAGSMKKYNHVFCSAECKDNWESTHETDI